MQSKSKKTALYYNSESQQLALRETSPVAVFEMLNQRWSLMILRELSWGSKRFNELSKKAKINPNTLRDRLREMESFGIVNRQIFSSMPPKVAYCLTEKGTELCKLFQVFDAWADKFSEIELPIKTKGKSKLKSS